MLCSKATPERLPTPFFLSNRLWPSSEPRRLWDNGLGFSRGISGSAVSFSTSLSTALPLAAGASLWESPGRQRPGYPSDRRLAPGPSLLPSPPGFRADRGKTEHISQSKTQVTTKSMLVSLTILNNLTEKFLLVKLFLTGPVQRASVVLTISSKDNIVLVQKSNYGAVIL